jgi:hypothetical protein
MDYNTEAEKFNIDVTGMTAEQIEIAVVEAQEEAELFGDTNQPTQEIPISEPTRDLRANNGKSNRKERTPVKGRKQRLNVDRLDPNYHYRFVRDDQMGRIQEFEDAGYELVNKEDGTRDNRVVGTNTDGSPRHDFLMKQKKEYYEEDQRTKATAIKKKEDAAIEEPGDGNFSDVQLQNNKTQMNRLG